MGSLSLHPPQSRAVLPGGLYGTDHHDEPKPPIDGRSREAAETDSKVNLKAELEIELLHHKLDSLREIEVVKLIDDTVRELQAELRLSQRPDPNSAGQGA
jgi:hypothetical protein